MTLTSLPIHQLAGLLASREVSAVDVTQAYLNRMDQVDPSVGAYLHRDARGALEAAARADQFLHDGQASVLTGIPFASKDNFFTAGLPTTCASRALAGFDAAFTATAISRLLVQGAILLGKLNMDEFAMGSSTETSAYGPTRNPWDLGRVPGGSSGGSAAAVAADLCAAALGTDTGGSIRQPASLCGVVGFKPTYGRISRYGVVPYAHSLDQPGMLTKDVRDAAFLLKALAGPDPRDPTAVHEPVPDYTSFLDQNIRGLKIGLPREYWQEGMMSDGVRPVMDQAVKELQTLGAKIIEVSLPHSGDTFDAYYVIGPAELAADFLSPDDLTDFLSSYDLREGLLREAQFGPEVVRRLLKGAYYLSSAGRNAYRQAKVLRQLIRQDFIEAFKKVDVLAAPASPSTAFRLGTKTSPEQMRRLDVHTLPVNLAGVPALSLPCGFDHKKLPVGLQLIGRHWGENRLLRTAHAYEQATRWHRMKPPLLKPISSV